jgi:hypothetical protein
VLDVSSVSVERVNLTVVAVDVAGVEGRRTADEFDKRVPGGVTTSVAGG